jgi:hypothetical protein
MRDIATSEFSNMTGLLNLSLVWATIGVAGAAVLGLLGSHWGTAAAVLVVGLVLSSVSYRAAIREGSEAGRYRHAAFDLYRHEILKQMALEIPEDAATERALWHQLTAEMVDQIFPVPGVPAAPDGSATAAKAKTHQSKTAASPKAGAGR